jgi:hypothetical protein
MSDIKDIPTKGKFDAAVDAMKEPLSDLIALVTARNDEVARLNTLSPTVSYEVTEKAGEKFIAYFESGEMGAQDYKQAVKDGKLIRTSTGLDTEKLDKLTDQVNDCLKQLKTIAFTQKVMHGGSGIRAAPTANGANKKPKGFYEMTDEIWQDMKVREDPDNDKLVYYEVDGRVCHSKEVNAVIAWHRINDKAQAEA